MAVTHQSRQPQPSRDLSTLPSSGVRTSGKFLHVHGAPFLVRGVAYGTFAPRRDGHQFPELARITADFDLMVTAGINTVRTYTVPPIDVLDAAADRGLRVVAGLAWPQHIAFLDARRTRRDIISHVGRQAASIAGHPAILLAALGNEIPPAIVRWHGRRRVERFLRHLFDEVHERAPGTLLTYVNYPPTAFLELPSADVHAFNVYLHDEPALRAYVAHLHHATDGKPLLLTECGADSQRLGEDGQAALVSMQTRVAFDEGACGAIVFGWTDEWWRGGAAIDDWSFGLVDRERRPKPAYRAVADVFHAAPFHTVDQSRWPTVSVVVCAFNAAETIGDCLASLERVDYPSLEVIVVDDGSKDETASIARLHPRVQLIQTPNRGLSVARNVGLQASTSDIVVYVDADVRVEPSWLAHLIQPFAAPTVVLAGGPNVVPHDDGWFAQCVARSPGAPAHVLLDDRIAEHVPGCNLAIRRTALLDIGGFDPIYLRAGDDVDVGWRLQDRGGVLAFSSSALVWHHHRDRLAAYWRQQVGYGEGEAWLRASHQHRFAGLRISWRGRIYSRLPFVRSLSARLVHSGRWGTASFPSVYHVGVHPLQAMPHMFEWQFGALLLVLVAGLRSATAGSGTAALIAGATGLAALGLTVVKCGVYAWRSDIHSLPPIGRWGAHGSRVIYRLTILFLHVVQPAARTFGYLRGTFRPPALKPEPRPALDAVASPLPTRRGERLGLMLGLSRQCRFWGETWTSAEVLLTRLVDRLRMARFTQHIWVDDGWQPDRDISVALGLWAWAHLQAVVEDHGAGRCLLRARVYLRPRAAACALAALLLLAATIGAASGAPAIGAGISVAAVVLAACGAWAVSRDAQRMLDVVASVAREQALVPLTSQTARAEAGAAIHPPPEANLTRAN